MESIGGRRRNRRVPLRSFRNAVSGTVIAATMATATACTEDGYRRAARFVPWSAEARSAECRELASPESDVESARKALAACEGALQKAPNDPELHYSRGLAALSAERADIAVASFDSAAALGHCQANYYLGEEAWHFGKDAERAEKYYTKGAECGDDRASALLLTPELVERSGYPAYLRAIYNGDVAALNRERPLAASYALGFYEFFSEQFVGDSMSLCWSATHFKGGELLNALKAAENGDATNLLEGMLYDRAMPLLVRLILPAQGESALAEVRRARHAAGKADATRIVRGSECEAMLPSKLVAGIDAFARSPRSLFDVVRELAPEVQSYDDLQKLLGG